MDGPVEDIPASEMGEKYASLRIVSPRADDALCKSMKKYGQLTPVVCARMGDGYELIDGFKRLRACRRNGKHMLKARVLDATERVCKAAIIQLNRGKSISELEEAMILSSLRREDGLTQTEIAVLLGRHKSWVSRRISLIERLHEEVREDIRLGILPASVGRELAMLPRGNQKETAAAIVKHRFSTREATKLIGHLLSRPRWEHRCILAAPWEFVGPREHKPEGFAGRLVLLERISKTVAKEVKSIIPQEAAMFSGLLNACLVSAEDVVAALKEVCL